jgi:UDP-glucose 4-epimerase
MAILVTGGAGYVGSHTVHELLDRGERVVVIDNLSTGVRDSIPKETDFVLGSTGDVQLVSRTIRQFEVESIIHFAASLVVPDSIQYPLSYYRNNVVNTCNLISVAIEQKVRNFIFSSTAAVYGNAEVVPVREDAPKVPISPYGSSKLMAETILQDAGRAYGLHFVILRYFNVAGADPKRRTGQSTPNATHLIKVACEAAIGKRNRVQIFGTDYPTPDGTCTRDYIHVSDLANAHLAALTYLRGGGSNVTLNCGYGRGTSVLEVIESVKRLSGIDFLVERTSRREGDPEQLVADTSLIRNTFNWHPQFDEIDTIVRDALAWERMLHQRAPR